MELDVNKWIQCFSRKESDDTESTLNGTDSDISDLTGNSEIKSEDFDLYKYTKKTSPSLIEADKYYDYYNTQVIRFDVSFLSDVASDGTLTYTPINSLDTEYGSVTATNIAKTNNANNNFFVSANIEDFGSYKTLSLTLKDRTFNTLAGYIYQAIQLGNGNVKAFGSNAGDTTTSEGDTIDTELTDSTTLKFLKNPVSNKIKQNLKIRYGYQTTTRYGTNNFTPDSSPSWKSMYGGSTARWTTATKWEGSANINDEQVTPNKVLAINKHQTTKVIPEMDFFITDLTTQLTSTGIVYNIKASSTENFILNNIKFIQQYTVLRGKPKSLLASLMRVFNSNAEAPIKLVWCDKYEYRNYLNGSDILKNYKTGEFEVMDEETVSDSIEEDRQTINDLDRQIEILNGIKNLFIYNAGSNLKIGDSDLSYKKFGSKIIKALNESSADGIETIPKHEFSNVFFYPTRDSISDDTDTDTKINTTDPKDLLYIYDISKNYQYFGKQERMGSDATISLSYHKILGTWLNFVKVKACDVSDVSGEASREDDEYSAYKAVVKRQEASNRLQEAKNKLKKDFDNISSFVTLSSDSSISETDTMNGYSTSIVCNGLLTSIPKKDNIQICEEYNSYDLKYYDDDGVNIGIFKNKQPDSIYSTYSTSGKDLTTSKDYNTLYKKMLDDSSVWNRLTNSSGNLILGNSEYLFNNLKGNTPQLSIIDSYDSSKHGQAFVDAYKKYKKYNLYFLGSKNIRRNDSSIELTSGVTNIFEGILSPSHEDYIVEKSWTSRGAFGLSDSRANIKLIKSPSEIESSLDSYREKINNIKIKLQGVIDSSAQNLVLKTTPGGFGSIKDCTFTYSKKTLDSSKTSAEGEVENYYKTDTIEAKIYNGSALSNEFKDAIKIGSDDISSDTKDVLDFLDSFFQIGDLKGASIVSVIKLLEKVLEAVNSYYSTPNITLEQVESAKNNFANVVKKYIVSELKSSIAAYYLAAIDYYYCSKNVSSSTGDTASYSWRDLAKKVFDSVKSTTIEMDIAKGKIKKQGDGDSLSFSDMEFGCSIDGTKNYIKEAYDYIKMDGSKTPDQISAFASELDSQISEFMQLKDSINAEYAKKSESKIGKEITISLGSEDSQYKNNTFTKSLSSLFNDFCSQCMPMIKTTDVIATTTANEEGNSTTSTLTDEACKQSLGWSIVGKYKGQPIVGFYYKEPKIPKYIRKYDWGNGNAKMHCIKDISISTASEFAMYSSINTMTLNSGKLSNAGIASFGEDKRLEVSSISKSGTSESDDAAIEAYYPNLVANSDKQKNLMNNLLQSVNKGTITLLGDPSLVFSGEIQPYTYPIFLNIKLQQEGSTWSKKWDPTTEKYVETGGQVETSVSYLSGIYVVGKITHSFSSSGYTTTLEITRYPGLDKNYKSAISFD